MITKTHYVSFRSCSRCYYYILNNKDQAVEDPASQKRINDGYLVNQYAYDLFPGIISTKKDLKSVNPTLQVEITKKLLNDDKPIAEASFKFNDLFCAVDILVKNNDGYDIYEVKGSTNLEKHLDEYCADVAFQKYVLQKCGLKINSCYLVHLNSQYVKQGDIEVKKLLSIDCLDDFAEFIKECEDVEKQIPMMEEIQKSKTIPTYGDCSSSCPFYDFCHKDLPTPNVLSLARMTSKKGHKLITQGIKSFDDLIKNNVALSSFQAKQLSATQKNEIYLDKVALNLFTSKLKYPLYYLDFETMDEAIPKIDGTSPYQQVPFQYSLHIEKTPGVEPDHKAFLGEKLDCQYELAKQLCHDIPKGVMSIAYNMGFEKSVIRRLAKAYPDLEQHLMDIHDHMVDLLEPFRDGSYYNPKQNGSTSIKYVMPAVCPKMASEYKQLPVVHNGTEALMLFPLLVNMTGEEYKTKRDGLLAYCKLDTYSMVKILDELRKIK